LDISPIPALINLASIFDSISVGWSTQIPEIGATKSPAKKRAAKICRIVKNSARTRRCPILLKIIGRLVRCMSPRGRPRDYSQERLAGQAASSGNAALIVTFSIVQVNLLRTGYATAVIWLSFTRCACINNVGLSLYHIYIYMATVGRDRDMASLFDLAFNHL